jgi:hypothetical protein
MVKLKLLLKLYQTYPYSLSTKSQMPSSPLQESDIRSTTMGG